jgi:hypothetical protein
MPCEPSANVKEGIRENAQQLAPFTVAKRFQSNQGATMNISLSLGPLVALIAGILILVMPRLLNYIVALYLIIIGIIGLVGAGHMHL